MNRLAEQILIDILKQEMQIPNNNIWIRDQNRKIPGDEQLYMIVGMVDTPQVIGVANTVVPTVITPEPPDPPYEGMKEIQESVQRENIMIDILSRSPEAIMRRAEILLALRSVYSVQLQEKNWFKIFRIPSLFVNSSDAEGGSQINRFSVTIACHVWYRKEKLLSSPEGDYYNDFDTRVDDHKTIGTDEGIIEFNIKEED